MIFTNIESNCRLFYLSGAIKFGDPLTLEMTKLLVRKLACCEMPFQCAHGRPVLTPLLELTEVSPNVSSLREGRITQ